MANRVLAFSPHLDDAALSAGAFLSSCAAAGDQVTVVTLFAGIQSPPFSDTADYIHGLWGMTENWIEARRTEDRRAMVNLGVGYRHEDFLDAIYRRESDGSWLLNDKRRPWDCPEEGELALRETLAGAVGEIIASFAPSLVLTCSAIGNHVDHRRTRDAVLTAVGGSGSEVRLWEDLPYAGWLPAPGQPPLPDGLRIDEQLAAPGDEDAWAAKARAVDCYVSQHSMLSVGHDFRLILDARGRLHGARQGHDRAEAFVTVTTARLAKNKALPSGIERN
jgi:LmbE family N-acetylglucosaminyl deacetylase